MLHRFTLKMETLVPPKCPKCWPVDRA